LWRADGGISGQQERERSKRRAGFRDIFHSASPCVRVRNASGEMPPVACVFRVYFALSGETTSGIFYTIAGNFSKKRGFPGSAKSVECALNEEAHSVLRVRPKGRPCSYAMAPDPRRRSFRQA
jgi:hypothetical protein